jgi:hypothetical protein
MLIQAVRRSHLSTDCVCAIVHTRKLAMLFRYGFASRGTPMKTIRNAVALAVVAAAGTLATPALHAHALSLDECSEGSDFIRNAALSRDQGMPERQFVAQFQADVQALQRLPAELRWFVQDRDDEFFLLSAVQDVFRQPRPAAVHQAQFAIACVRMIGDEPAAGVRI